MNATGTSILWYASANSSTPLAASTPLQNDTVYYASQTSTLGCESINRLQVTVLLNSDITQISAETTTCAANGTTYTIEAIFNGEATFVVNGNGAPGQFLNNGNGTSTWTSSPISYTVTNYNVEIQDANDCNSVVLSGSSPQECLTTPFNCGDGLAYILTNTGTSQSNYVTGLYTLNLATNVQTLIKYPLVEASSPSRFINGIGYNTLDNFLYGLLQNTNKIARIDASGDVEYLTITGPFTTGYYSSGDIDPNGILYLHGENKFISVDLNPSSPK